MEVSAERIIEKIVEVPVENIVVAEGVETADGEVQVVTEAADEEAQANEFQIKN